jgi:sacsin
MGEIGLHSDISVDIFIGCARRIEALFSSKRALSSDDETLTIALHQYFIQNFERFDRSRSFFETISQIAFVPAVSYERAPSAGSSTSRTIVVRYSDCATPDEQALVFTTKPILLISAVPPRILWSRLCMVSPPEKDVVLAHLFNITGEIGGASSSPTLQWQFYLPMVEVFQEIFKYLQTYWETLSNEERLRVADAAIIPIGSSLVKGSRLYFHLGENLAPLMYEVPRVFGAYDTLFRQLGSKDSPEVKDYIVLLQDLHTECKGKSLNLNELIAVARIVNLLADVLADSSQKLSIEAKRSIYLPSSSSLMEPVLQMAYNDAPWLCARIDLSDLHVVHPRISTRWCQILGVPGISAVVTEELQSGSVDILPPSDAIAHFNSILASQQFGNGVRRIITVQQQKATSNEPFGFIPDFEDINRRIVRLASFEIKCVDTLQSQFIAKLDHPFRRVDVTKSSASMRSLSFVDESTSSIYIAKRTLEAQIGLRLSQVVAGCINQLLGGILQDCSSIESILTCDVMEIDSLLQLMNVYEDLDLIVEKLRGVVGEPLAEADQASIDLTPLNAHLPGEIIAVELDGHLRYGKIVQEQKNSSGMSNYEVKVSRSLTKWYSGSQIFTFRSARSNHNAASAGTQREIAFVENLATQVLSNAAGAVQQDQLPASLSLAGASPNGGSLAAGVPATNVVSAVNDLLSRFNISLSTEYEDLLNENLRLRQRLEQAEEGRRVASAQIDDAIREKRDAQDSLICAICLENNVDCVLIPCGHIYCEACVTRLPRPSCPICRQHIASSSAFHVPS